MQYLSINSFFRHCITVCPRKVFATYFTDLPGVLKSVNDVWDSTTKMLPHRSAVHSRSSNLRGKRAFVAIIKLMVMKNIPP
jgi:hypothetical protein